MQVSRIILAEPANQPSQYEFFLMIIFKIIDNLIIFLGCQEAHGDEETKDKKGEN